MRMAGLDCWDDIEVALSLLSAICDCSIRRSWLFPPTVTHTTKTFVSDFRDTLHLAASRINFSALRVGIRWKLAHVWTRSEWARFSYSP